MQVGYEGFLVAFGVCCKVDAKSAVDLHVDEARNNEGTFGVNDLVGLVRGLTIESRDGVNDLSVLDPEVVVGDNVVTEQEPGVKDLCDLVRRYGTDRARGHI